jgi:co-chaperonin GroES (HSP10)
MLEAGVSVITDPIKKEIFDAIGDLSKLDRLFSARVLVATYIPPRKSKGGIIFTDKELQESVYQGAVGLVVAKGPRAFKDDASNEFHMQDVAIGEWVVFRPGDSKRVQVNGVNCRIVDDTQIDMVVTEPDFVTHRQTDARVK